MIAITREINGRWSRERSARRRRPARVRHRGCLQYDESLVLQRHSQSAGGLFKGRNTHASQLRPLQLIKAQQTDIAAPVQANALERAGDLKRQRPVGGDNGFAHPAMAGMELAQGVVDLVGFVKRRFGIFGDRSGITRKRGAKCRRSRRVFTMPRGSLRKRIASKPCSIRCSVAVVAAWVLSSPTTSQANSGILRSMRTMGREDCCRRFRPSSRMPTALTTIPSTVAAQQIEVVQLLVDFVVGITDQRREALRGRRPRYR